MSGDERLLVLQCLGSTHHRHKGLTPFSVAPQLSSCLKYFALADSFSFFMRMKETSLFTFTCVKQVGLENSGWNRWNLIMLRASKSVTYRRQRS